MVLFNQKVSIAFLICLFFAANFAEAKTSVGVKEGDWIEYTVNTTGTPPREFAVTWAKMEILNVQDTTVRTNVTVKTLEGNLKNVIMTFNLEKGQVGAWFIIPAGLNTGDCFWDASLGRNVTVEGEEQLTFGGATRTITNATTPQRLKYWDKATGIFIQCIDVFDNYSINATAVRTNMWDTKTMKQQKDAFNENVAAVVLAVTACLLLLVASQRKTGRKSSAQVTLVLISGHD
jgi:hypothetical protein